jgi:hypothetical protein
MKPYAFVAMPFGVKQGSQGHEIDFNLVYAELIKPALEAAGLEPLRTDQRGICITILASLYIIIFI